MLRLQQRHPRQLARYFDALSYRVEPVAHHPRSGWIAVDCHGGSILGPVGKRFAIARRPNIEAVHDRRCLVLRGLVGKDWQALIGCVLLQHVGARATGLGEPHDVLRTPPLVGAISVRVGDDHQVGVEVVGFTEVGRVQNCLVAV